jgi:tetratricopeptide (TPR) repeat protein
MKLTFPVLCLATALAWPLFSASRASADETAGVRGKVLDEAGEPIPDVEVTFEFTGESRKKIIRQVQTDKKGMYIRIGLLRGPYTVSYRKEGYVPLAIDTYFSPGRSEVPDTVLHPPEEVVPVEPSAPTVDMITPEEMEAEAVAALRGIYDSAVTALTAGRYDEAQPLFEQIVEQVPEMASAHYNLGYIALQRNDAAAAEAAFRKTIEVQPTHAGAYAALSTLLAVNDPGASFTLLNDASETFLEDAGFQLALGIAALNTGQTPEAQAAFERVRTLDPEQAEALYYLGTILIGQGDTTGSVALLKEYLVQSPDGPNAGPAAKLVEALGG